MGRGGDVVEAQMFITKRKCENCGNEYDPRRAGYGYAWLCEECNQKLAELHKAEWLRLLKKAEKKAK